MISKNTELYESFYRHAKKSFSDNNLLFLKEVEELRLLKTQSACKKKATDIINKYIIDNSFYEINSDSKKRGDIALGIGKCKKYTDYIKLFDNIYMDTRRNIELDLLSSYTSSNSFKKIKKKINGKCIESIETLTVNDVAYFINFIFDNSNFKDNTLGEKYAKIFYDNEINGVCLKYINDSYLDKLGINIVGHKLYIIDSISSKTNYDYQEKTKNMSFCTIL